MTRRRRQFSPEFKEEAIRMVLEGDRTVASVAREFDINASTLGSWVNRHRIASAQARGCGPESPGERRICGGSVGMSCADVTRTRLTPGSGSVGRPG
ncbi:transposase [Nonomuraea sp. NPDC049607]|uniref:transposase n=1 Tax=Nonomuraea sp. NPDC049607 TaxID=3154732 RepID=UPI00343B75D0